MDNENYQLIGVKDDGQFIEMDTFLPSLSDNENYQLIGVEKLPIEDPLVSVSRFTGILTAITFLFVPVLLLIRRKVQNKRWKTLCENGILGSLILFGILFLICAVFTCMGY